MNQIVSRRLLILEDDTRLAQSLAREFEDHGYSVSVAPRLEDIGTTPFDYAVIDLRLNGEFGLDAIARLKSNFGGCRIVVLSGYGSVATAVEAIKRGAVDYLNKPASFARIEAALLSRNLLYETEFKAPSLSQAEHEYIDFVLTQNNGNISKTAKTLGLHRQSLQRKLRKYT